MAQPILSITDRSSKTHKAVANLLPCRVHHDGPVDPIERFWNPVQTADGNKLAFLRGRKLQGKTVSLPKEYRGVVVERQADGGKQSQNQPTHGQSLGQLDDDDDVQIIDEPQFKRGAMKITAEFDEMIVWGHEEIADASGDPYMRGVEEWIQLADKIHSYPESTTAPTT